MDLSIDAAFTQCAPLGGGFLEHVVVPVTLEYHDESQDNRDPGNPLAIVTVDASATGRLLFSPSRFVRMDTTMPGTNVVVPRFVMLPATLMGTMAGDANVQAQGLGGDVPVAAFHIAISQSLPLSQNMPNVSVQSASTLVFNAHQHVNGSALPIQITQGLTGNHARITLHLGTPTVVRYPLSDITRIIPR